MQYLLNNQAFIYYLFIIKKERQNYIKITYETRFGQNNDYQIVKKC